MAKDPQARWASDELVLKVKEAPERQWQLARACEMTPSMVTALLHGYMPVKPGDERIIKLAAAVGLAPERAFSRRPPTTR